MNRIPFAGGLCVSATLFVFATEAAYAQDLSHRKADLTVQVQTGSGTPLQGAEVQIEMLNHAFRFGCAVEHRFIDPTSNDYDEFTVTQLQKYFNSTTYGNFMKWSYYEGRTEEQNLAIAALPHTFNAFDGPDNLRLRGHVTVWGAWYQLPNRVRTSEDGAYISEQILEHVFDYHTTYKDSGIDNYDLYNEHFNVPQLLIDKIADPADMAAQAAEVATWFNKAKEADPNAILFINDFNILNDWSSSDDQVKAYKAFIDAVRDAGGQIDGIGLQAHMDHPNIPKADIVRRLDLLAAPMAATENHPDGLPGLRIEITELDMAIKNEIHNADWVPWTNATMEDQVALADSVITAAFEHPSVDGITIWGLDDLTHWRGNAIMYDNLAEGSTDNNRIPQDPVLKETGQLWIDKVLGEWWQDHSGSSSPTGEYAVNTFKGTHRVTVTFNGEIREQIVTLAGDDTLTFEFAVDAADSSTYDSWAAFIEWGDADPARAADPDLDGRDNFEEFVYGTDPLATDDAPAARLLIEPSGAASLEFSIRAASGGIEVTPQYSTDLIEWKFAGLTTQEAIQNATPDISQGTATYLIPLPDVLDTFFYRLKFTEAALD